MESQVTTKRGDQGETTALSGRDYPKNHPVMEAVGALDELRAQLALLRVKVRGGGRPEPEVMPLLDWLQHALFLVGAQCSDPLFERPEYHRGRIGPEHVEKLEVLQGVIEARVTLPKSFIAGASNELAAQTDICCTLARRFERRLASLCQALPEMEPGALVPFVNRLSDALYMAARLLEHGEHEPVDYAALG